MNREELDRIMEIVEDKYRDMPPQYLKTIEDLLEKSQFNENQAMAIITIAENIAIGSIRTHDNYRQRITE